MNQAMDQPRDLRIARDDQPHDGEIERMIRRTIRERSLLALQRRWLPFALDAAYASVEAVAQTFWDGPVQLDDTDCRGVYATLAAHSGPERDALEDYFATIVLADVLPAALPSANLLDRLAAIPSAAYHRAAPPHHVIDRETEALAPRPIVAGQPTPLLDLIALPIGPLGFATAVSIAFDAAPFPQLSGSAPPVYAAALTIVAAAGDLPVAQSSLLLLPRDDDRWDLAIAFPVAERQHRAPGASPIADWQITALLGTEELAGTWHGTDEEVAWSLATPLAYDDLGQLALIFTPTAGQDYASA